ncbi:MAG: M20/M25/M40 family metallo-hydrolase [Holophagaceae bacterium]|nr:M20/M25/M40 family metallo-hydrolase [Holophagaceae bacterium]
MNHAAKSFIASFSAVLVLGAQAPARLSPSETRMKREVAVLAAPDMEGRGNGSKGLAHAADYIERYYRSHGIKTQRQAYPFLTGVVVKEGKAFLGKGDSPQAPLQWGKDIEAYSFSGNATFNSKALVFAGYGLQAGAYNDFNGVDLTGKIIIIGRELPDIHAFASLSAEDKSLRGRLRRFETARIGGLILLEEGDAARPLKLISELPTLKFPVLSMTAKALDPVCGDLKGRLKKIRETGAPQSQDFVWAPWSFMGLTLSLERKLTDVPNLIATIPGRDPKLKTEAIVLGAHMDHLGRGERHSLGGASAQGQFHAGADDNASGTVMLMELALQLKSAKPKRTLVMAHFSGEEEGMLGSAYWIKHPTVPIQNVKAMLNFDMVGRMDSKKPMLLLGGLGAPKAALEHAKSLAPANLAIGGDLGAAAGSSDHLSFALAKIPTFFFFTGLHADYHKPSDLAEKINGAGMAMVAKYAQSVTLDLANAAQTPVFDPETAKLSSGHGAAGMKVSFGVIPDYAEHTDGFHINGVSAGSSAEALGLKSGDIIVTFGVRSVKTIYDYMDALTAGKAGESVTVKWLRDGKPMEGQAVLKSR